MPTLVFVGREIFQGF